MTGKSVIDPRTGFPRMRPTDLLIESFGLPVVSSGTLDASTGDEETMREIRCVSSDGQPFAGPYLLEANSTLPGRAHRRQQIDHFCQQLYPFAETDGGFGDRAYHGHG